MEMQFKTSEDYAAARNGPAAHYNRKGKDREAPVDFNKLDLSEIPHYLIYVDSKTIYVAGDFENTYHYYQDQLDDETIAHLLESDLVYKVGSKKHFDKESYLGD